MINNRLVCEATVLKTGRLVEVQINALRELIPCEDCNMQSEEQMWSWWNDYQWSPSVRLDDGLKPAYGMNSGYASVRINGADKAPSKCESEVRHVCGSKEVQPYTWLVKVEHTLVV